MRVRHRARIAALQALFEIDCAHHHPAVVIERRLGDVMLPEAGASFARELVDGVGAHQDELDALIGRYAPEWPVEQIALIDRNILRLAIFEILLRNDTPVKVAINEAVELAKEFGSDSSGRFVNGVLGSLVAAEPSSSRR
ncbi:MAG: transcription antitermination factor NusB [Anaerolineae bacterium]|jgi:N utilization substance protein B